MDTWTIFLLLITVPILVASSGYDELGGASSGGSSGSAGSSPDGVGTDINDYASNNGQIPNHLVSEPTVSFQY